ncbi:hypothetical protein ACFWA9_04330 [Kitasatospora sp. NPDC059973]|uniref:hypothetical protein n=1 Tax=Kitasatospora sp. NPDC059973 TaxID=3347020 RepID=UPI00367AE9B0
MVNKELCNTTEHIVVEADQREGRSGPVSLARALRQAGLGITAMGLLSAVLFAFVGPGAGFGVLAFSVFVVAVAFFFFVSLGHKPTCSAKKALVFFFGWVEYAF